MADKVKVPLRPYPRVSLQFKKPSKTRASEMASTNLKALVERFRISGQAPPPMQFGDATGLPGSRLEAMERLQAAQDAFNDLPFKVRQAVGHDPRGLEAWIASNPQLAAEYGLLEPVSPPPQPSSPAKQASSADAGEGESQGDA
nr:MAG: internal scaffolding protein [Microvirus sp.]